MTVIAYPGAASNTLPGSTGGTIYVFCDDDLPPDCPKWSERYKEWKRRKSAEHAQAQRALFERFEVCEDTRFAISAPALLRTGRRTKAGRTRNAVRQLPMLGIA